MMTDTVWSEWGHTVSSAIALALFHTVRNGKMGDHRMWASLDALETMERLLTGRYKDLLPATWEIPWVPKGYKQKIISHTDGTYERILTEIVGYPI